MAPRWDGHAPAHQDVHTINSLHQDDGKRILCNCDTSGLLCSRMHKQEQGAPKSNLALA